MEAETRRSSVIVFSKLASVIILFNSVTLFIAGILLRFSAALASFNFWLKLKCWTIQSVQFLNSNSDVNFFRKVIRDDLGNVHFYAMKSFDSVNQVGWNRIDSAL